MAKKATKVDREYMSKVAELGCIICSDFLGIPDSPASIHHIRSGQGLGQRASHKDILPLCHQHHQGGGLGVAIHAGQKTWEEKYATESELLNRVKERL